MSIHRLSSGWLPRTIGVVALMSVLASSGLAADPIGSADFASNKHYTKDPVFHLPISIQEKMRSTIREVQLFMKTANGEWRSKEIAPVTQKSFTFRAPCDGEYWFTLVTVDTRGMPMPADLNRLAPNEIVMVVVDTQPPTIDLVTVKMPSGEVLLRCNVNDANPDLTTLKITYRGSDHAIHALEPMPGTPLMFRVNGPEALMNPVHVTVADLAGNMTARDVDLQDDLAKLWPTAQPASQPSPAPVTPQTSSLVQTAAVNTQALPAVQPQSRAEAGPGFVQGGIVLPVPPAGQQFMPPANVPVPEAPRPVQQPVVPPVTASQAAPAAAGSIPKQFICTNRASLEYRIDQVGPSGVGKVEVWVTSDQGATWKRHCDDADRRSPADFDLPGDGLYGVRVVVTNGNGIGGHAPAPGEQPQIWIEVDTVAPSVQLKEIEPITSGGVIDLRWTASDKNLGSESINLYYATRKEGPYQPVVRGLKNDGLYHWTFPHDAGSQFFVRLEAVDLAGNVARCDSQNAVVLDMTEPRASVLGVQGLQTVGGRQ
jgi:hypothetical protein